MEILLKKLGISINHLKCLDRVFRENHKFYKQMESKMTSELGDDLEKISRELYAGGKKRNSFNRQMILGDVIEYIFNGRAYYYATKSGENFSKFSKLVLYCVNQLLLFDTITINHKIRKAYIESLEKTIPIHILYERKGDRELANKLKVSKEVIWGTNWKKYDNFVDSILPKTLGCPKELVVFLELIRLSTGSIIPLLLTQRIFVKGKAIAPPDFLVLKKNKEIFGIEVGYKKEEQSREFSLQTGIPTFAVDLIDNMHNRCPKCGENILYCDKVIKAYSNNTLDAKLDRISGKILCYTCPNFDSGQCKYSNYYGRYKGDYFYGPQPKDEDKKNRHYHAKCVLDDYYLYRNKKKPIIDHKNEFFAQIPEIEGIVNL